MNEPLPLPTWKTDSSIESLDYKNENRYHLSPVPYASSNNHNQLSSIYLDLINVKSSIRLLAYKAMIIKVYFRWEQIGNVFYLNLVLAY